LIREKLQQGVLKLLPISTNEQLADFLAKALSSPKVGYFIYKLNMINIYSDSTYGRVLNYDKNDNNAVTCVRSNIATSLVLVLSAL
jgi:hypothetical protein